MLVIGIQLSFITKYTHLEHYQMGLLSDGCYLLDWIVIYYRNGEYSDIVSLLNVISQLVMDEYMCIRVEVYDQMCTSRHIYEICCVGIRLARYILVEVDLAYSWHKLAYKVPLLLYETVQYSHSFGARIGQDS
jgi:hypothetical protein